MELFGDIVEWGLLPQCDAQTVYDRFHKLLWNFCEQHFLTKLAGYVNHGLIYDLSAPLYYNMYITSLLYFLT